MQSIYLLVLIIAILVLGLVIAGSKLSKLKANTLFIVLFAVIFGLLIGSLAYLPLSKMPGIFGIWIPVVFYIVVVVGSVWIFLNRRKAIEQTLETISKFVNAVIHLRPQIPQIMQKAKESREILLDTSVLIDGRIADIALSGFVPGKLILPRFILSELQNIADSDEPLRRAKGRRGLDVLQVLKKETKMETVTEKIPQFEEVDLKLVQLAKLRNAEILTTDFNLNKVAKIEGVRVLNINELSQALRPVILPGEVMEIRIVQAGKEKNQGVGYLADGTMIVVEGGDRLVGQTVIVTIKRVLQTAAGKMFFAILKDNNRRK